ncbi:hypothetical protein F3N42_14935 [Marinihelvus fidelis]|uniref:Uncharacterized protein n=1 Tax=Marinihelvus fidelis TaxID=2613842 RepID=A0A5N0T685_9GAMM|nr:hypothetical protein [Marinihelvus fidelis]KAA9129657.1 hypothetical protein F3N42_14935 [Marinihelvus fidelis]
MPIFIVLPGIFEPPVDVCVKIFQEPGGIHVTVRRNPVTPMPVIPFNAPDALKYQMMICMERAGFGWVVLSFGGHPAVVAKVRAPGYQQKAIVSVVNRPMLRLSPAM